jgi:clan AA aspartic protease (TIGR02281 family)
MRVAPILFSVLLVLLSLSAPFFAEAGGGIVMGTVSSQNGIRLEGAKVEIEGVARTETDGTGHFLFQNIPAGFYKIEISKRGFPTINRALLVKSDRVQSLAFILPGTAALSPTSQITAVPFIRQGNALLVRGRIAGRGEVTFLLDTGATYCSVSVHLAEEMRLLQRSDGLWVTVQTASGTLKAPLVFLPSVAIGDFEEKGIEALVHDLPGQGGVDGLLGLSFLNRFRYTIDPEASELILRR